MVHNVGWAYQTGRAIDRSNTCVPVRRRHYVGGSGRRWSGSPVCVGPCVTPDMTSRSSVVTHYPVPCPGRSRRVPVEWVWCHLPGVLVPQALAYPSPGDPAPRRVPDYTVSEW